jgi:hypothetical protein
MKRILEYFDFISERLLLENLILESNVVYSPKFKKILSKMKESNISQSLLEIEEKDLEIPVNFFDIKIDNDNVISFTNDRVAQAILNNDKELVRWTGNRGSWLTNSNANINIFKILGYNPVIGSPVYQPSRTEIGEVINRYLSAKTNKNWCYVKFEGGEGVYNSERLTDAKEDLRKKVFNTSRQEIRIGRAIRVLLNAKGLKFTDAEIEGFVNEFRSILSVMNNVFSRFELVDGEDLLFWYNRKNYEFPQMGNLGTSCQAVGRRDWLEIYIDNPDTVKLLILKSFDNPDKIIGRTLIWNLENGDKLMDCIYVSKDSDRNVFKELAKSRGYIVREDNYYETYVAYTKIKPNGYDSYPSIDNMRYWDKSTGKLSTNSFPGSSVIIWSEEDEDMGDEDYDED